MEGSVTEAALWRATRWESTSHGTCEAKLPERGYTSLETCGGGGQVSKILREERKTGEGKSADCLIPSQAGGVYNSKCAFANVAVYSVR